MGAIARSSTDRYSAASIALHWIMLLLLAAVYAAMELREYYPRGSDPRETLKSLHYMLGLTVLLFVAIRIYARATRRAPPIVPPLRNWQRAAAGVTHLALYALMIAMPIAGWVILSAEGTPVPFWGLTLPPLVAESKALAHQVEEVHETIGKIGYFLIGIHAAAALLHHYVVRDNTLLRMIPRRS